jgi:hypothetical protein
VVTEKIDGTNAQVAILDDVKFGDTRNDPDVLALVDGMAIKAGSRKRWLSLDDDNFGFAQWVQEHADELVQLGPGRHYGEWWGHQVQRGYGKSERTFSLFNAHKWDDGRNLQFGAGKDTPPECVSVVPILARGPFDTQAVCQIMLRLKQAGSQAAPGWMKPEGVVVQHVPSRQLFKMTEDDL